LFIFLFFFYNPENLSPTALRSTFNLSLFGLLVVEVVEPELDLVLELGAVVEAVDCGFPDIIKLANNQK
jgi:hypothetical protein